MRYLPTAVLIVTVAAIAFPVSAAAGYWAVCCEQSNYLAAPERGGVVRSFPCSRCRMFPIKANQAIEMERLGCKWFNQRNPAIRYFRRADTCP